MKKLLLVFLFLAPFVLQAQIISTFAGTGSLGDSGDGSAATTASISEPYGLAFDSHGNCYFTEVVGNRVRKITPAGIISTIAGTASSGYNGDSIIATTAKLNDPTDVTTDSDGNIYIADKLNNRVRRIDAVTNIITTIAGNGTAGYGGDNGPATAAILNNPHNLCFDKAGNLYISDAVNYRVRKINTSGIITTIAGYGSFGFSGDNGPATSAQIQSIYGMCTDIVGNLYIAQTMDLRVRKVDTAGIITTIAGNGSAGPSGDGGAATNASLDPYRLVVDDIGNLYISCWINSNVRKIDESGVIHTIAGRGTYGYSGDGNPATAAELSTTIGIAFDTCYNLYIADENNNRIRKVALNPTCTIPSLSVNTIEDNTINIYPNPTNNLLQIDNLPNTASYSMQTIVGATMQQGTLHRGSNIIALGTLPNGMYLLQLIDEQGNRSVSKVMKE